MKGFKIAVAGKGGVGKTFIAGNIARLLARNGYRVLAVDADPAMNLHYPLGIPAEEAERTKPILEDFRLIEERVGVRPGSPFGGVFSLTPRVDDLVDRYGVKGCDGVTLVRLGTVKYGGSGCMCPANALLNAFLLHLLLSPGEAVVVDLEAGLEPFGRGTVKTVDLLICVVELTRQSVDSAIRIAELASDLGLRRIAYVVNKVSGEDLNWLRCKLSGLILASIPFDLKVAEADRLGLPILDYAPDSPSVKALEKLKTRIEEVLSS